MSRSLQVIAVSLPSGAGPAARLLAEVDRLHSRGGVRLLDMLLVSKSEDGGLTQASFGGGEDFGELVSRLFPVGDVAGGRTGDSPPELWAHAQSLVPGTAAAFLLVEHRWARGIFDLIEEEGGSLLGAGFLTPELHVTIDAEVTAIEEAARSIATAQAAEADAVLRASAAQAAEAEATFRAAAAQEMADEAVAASLQIRSAAAAEALRVLTEAGLVELAATHEATDALSAAGLVIAAADAETDRAVQALAAADEATAEAIAEDAEAVAAAEERRREAAQAASVTPAEIRVLRYLPTKLTFALIADKLGISREAAKSRAERAYRRLGVHNRADAVGRAKELRIIP